jgi:hypothetical protein
MKDERCWSDIFKGIEGVEAICGACGEGKAKNVVVECRIGFSNSTRTVGGLSKARCAVPLRISLTMHLIVSLKSPFSNFFVLARLGLVSIHVLNFLLWQCSFSIVLVPNFFLTDHHFSTILILAFPAPRVHAASQRSKTSIPVSNFELASLTLRFPAIGHRLPYSKRKTV